MCADERVWEVWVRGREEEVDEAGFWGGDFYDGWGGVGGFFFLLFFAWTDDFFLICNGFWVVGFGEGVSFCCFLYLALSDLFWTQNL